MMNGHISGGEGMPRNQPFKRHAIARNAVERLLRTAEAPLTVTAICQHSSIANTGVSPTNVYDMLKQFHKDGKIRKMPHAGAGKSRWAWEWVTPLQKTAMREREKLVRPYDKSPVKQIIEELDARPTVPEIVVSATSVVIKTSKIKITVEY